MCINASVTATLRVCIVRSHALSTLGRFTTEPEGDHLANCYHPWHEYDWAPLQGSTLGDTQVSQGIALGWVENAPLALGEQRVNR